MKRNKKQLEAKKIKIFESLKSFFLHTNRQVLIFVIALISGMAIALVLGYFYFNYHDKIFANEGIRDTLSYQGKITNADGVPPADGDYDMRFEIFDAQTDGTLLWTEIWDGQAHAAQTSFSKVSVHQGVFTVELNSLCLNWVGECSSNGGVTFNQDSFYLQVELDYDNNGTFEEIFSPRKRFTATPYSMNADKLDGHDATDFVLKTGASLSGELSAPKFIDNSVVAYYQFNGTANNSSSYGGLDGSLQNHANTNNDVLNLDGIDDHVLINDNDLLSFGKGSADTSFTFSAWIKPNNAANFTILSKGSGSDNPEYWFYLDENSKLNIRAFDSSKNNCFIGRQYNAASVKAGVWSMVSATYNGNGKDSGFKLYLNGEQVDDTDSGAACGYTAMANLASALYIGKYDASYANGQMDEVLIQNRAQTADEVRRLYDRVERNFINTNGLSTHYLYLEALNNNQASSGYLYFDPILNRIVSSGELYIPNNLPYLDNAGSRQDYTHFRDENLVLAYDFSDSKDVLVKDLIGHSDGTILNGENNQANFTSQGYLGYGFKFDTDSDKIDFNNIKNYLSADAGSVEMWIKLNNIATAEINYFIKMGQGDANQIVLAKQDTGSLYAQVGDSGLTDTNFDFTDTKWHHLALSWQNSVSGKVYKVYIDGNSVFSGAYNNLDVTQFNDPSSLGYGGKPNTSLDGNLDSVAIYNDVLSPAEIKSHANSGYDTLYVNNISNGVVNMSLGDFLGFPGSENGQNNASDPVYFKETKALSLAFSEGGGTTTISHDNNLIANLNGASWVKGYYGYGLGFDGHAYLSIADDENLNVSSNNFTLNFWIKCNQGDNPDNTRIISKRSGDVGYEIYLAQSGADQRLRLFLGDGQTAWNSAHSDLNPCDGNWNNILVSIDRGQGKYFLYQNGGFDNSSNGESISSLGDLNNTNEFDLGASFGSPYTNYFQGALDSVILYKDSAKNLYDSVSYSQNTPASFNQISRNASNGSSDFNALNAGALGNAGIFGLSSENNPDGYILQLLNSSSHLEGNDTVYNLIDFGRLNHDNPYAKDSFGNLKWDSTLNQFVLDQNLNVSGNLSASGVISGTMRPLGGATPGANCTKGDFTWDSDFIYICVDTDTWKKSAIAP